MNRKIHSMMLAIPIIAAIALMPWATSNVFAQYANTDAVVDASPEIGASDTEVRRAEVTFEGQTDGWAIIGGQAYAADIKISGNAVHHRQGLWKVSTQAEITVDNAHATLDLKGNAHDGKLRLHGSGVMDNGEPFRVFLGGHFAPVYGQQGDFVVAFVAAKVHNTETGVKIPLIQSGTVHVEPVEPTSDDYEEFLEEFDVTE